MIGWKCTVNFRNQCLRYNLIADYTIIMSRTLKVTGNHVMYDLAAWFLRLFMSRWKLCCWFVYFYKFRNKLPVPLPVMTIFFFVQCIIKWLFESVFMISRLLRSRLRLSASALTDNLYLDFDYSSSHCLERNQVIWRPFTARGSKPSED